MSNETIIGKNGFNISDKTLNELLDKAREEGKQETKQLNKQCIKYAPSDNVLIEKLAAVEHERWSNWMHYLFSKCYEESHKNGKLELKTGCLVIPFWYVQHWTRQAMTPYEKLSEEGKKANRKEVRKTLEAILELDKETMKEV